MASADQLIANLEGLNLNSFANELERVRARDALFEALRKVQTPWDIVWDHNWVNGATNASIKTLIEAGLFTEWAESGGAPKTTTELAELTGVDEVLIKRMLRQISGQQLITETVPDTYKPTPWATALATDPALASCYGEFYAQLNNPMFRSLPYFLKKTGFKNPTDDLAINSEMVGSFHAAMQCHSKYNLTSWCEVYPTDSIVGAKKEGVPLVVDVGDGSLVLQDLPDVVRGMKVDKAISVQGYDFFTPQPVKGARAYFMHNVLHDWTDDLAVKINENIASAMEKGYSRLLIHESLISSAKPLARVTTSDLTMMACLSAKERTESECGQLVESAGLKVVKIWRPPLSVESIIEAELV
ncbi:related to O-methyltransferase [Phialocephala subalpina]|uniref:Related to O-methyltransferase n=1 Tax=Phialocephala subalpina TaxID=576137 RepID=A0A1L7XMJ3_9HELO|nr:related to O-methyltransferase [Phialocephala subalpina]